MSYRARLVALAEFEESKVERDDRGRFAGGSGSASATAEPTLRERIASATGDERAALFEQMHAEKAREKADAYRGPSDTITVGGQEVKVILPVYAERAGDKLVTVDVGKLDEGWKRDIGFHVGPKGENAIPGRLERFDRFIKAAGTMEASEVTVDKDGKVGFSNGRHRMAYLRDKGLSKVPVAMDKASVKNAKKHGMVSLSYRESLALLLDWDEGAHPRDETGKFAGGGGSLTGSLSSERMTHEVTASGDRLFISSRLKPEKENWLDQADPVKERVAATVDLNPEKKSAYLNRMDARTRGKGYGPETMRAVLDHLRSNGYKTAEGYVESNNLASQSMMTKLGAVIDKDRRGKQGDYWQITLSAPSYRDRLALLLDWDESQVTRDEAGRFGSGGGGASKDADAGGRLSQSDFRTDEENSTERVREGATSRVAARLDVHPDDLKALAKEEGIPLTGNHDVDKERVVSSYLRTWAGSSGGPAVEEMARAVVAERLGGQEYKTDPDRDPKDTEAGRKFMEENPRVSRALGNIGTAMYDETQSWLKEKGITEVELQRAGAPGHDRLHTSWSTDWGGVRHESGREVVREKVPAKYVWSVPPTGFGTLAESEVVVLPRPKSLSYREHLALLLDGFDESKVERDEAGRFTGDGGGGASAGPAEGKEPWRKSWMSPGRPDEIARAREEYDTLQTHLKNQPDAEVARLYTQSGGTYSQVNDGLRDGRDMAEDHTVKVLDAMFREKAEPAPAVLFRGLSGFVPGHELDPDTGENVGLNLVVGQTFEDGGFVSTADTKEAAVKFATSGEGKLSGEGRGVIFKINTKGASALNMQPHSRYGEDEHLLNRGTSFKVRSIKEGKPGKSLSVVTLDVVVKK